MLMQTIIDGVRYKKLYFRKNKTEDYTMYKKTYVDGVLVYSAWNPVTYYVDTGKVYTEDVDFEASCLNPKTFTPTKVGWVFVGWREDTTASGSVLSSKVMGDAPVKLYAVFKQDITCTFKSYGSTQYASGTRYYNGAGVTANASITVPSGAAYSGWTWRGWSYAGQTAANTTEGYANGAVITNVSAAFTLYGLYSSAVKLSYYINGVARSISDTMYYNSAGTYLYPTVSVANPTLSGATFMGWSVTAGNATVSYGSLANGLQITANVTVYAVFKYADGTADQALTYYGNDDDYYSDTPMSITLTLPSTASSMTVKAMQPLRNFSDGGQENIWIGNTAIASNGQWHSVGTYTANKTLSVIFGYCVPNVTLTFRKTYTGKTIVG